MIPFFVVIALLWVAFAEEAEDAENDGHVDGELPPAGAIRAIEKDNHSHDKQDLTHSDTYKGVKQRLISY